MTKVKWERFAVAMVHEVPVAIVRMLETERELSPKEMSDRLKLPLGRVSYHVRLLADRKLITCTRVESRRGALEHYYRLATNGKAKP